MKHGFGVYSEYDVVSRCLAGVNNNKSDGVVIVGDSEVDPVKRIEDEFGPEDNPYIRTSPRPEFFGSWDNRRLKIATNPKYMDRCRESYAFRDLLGRKYNGVVFE